MPTISIITICYNAASTIERTLRSVAGQTYPDIEYIVIDGASKDETLAYVRGICPFAKVYSEPDKGIYDAMNKGLARAAGAYVWFLNAGDALYDGETVAKVFAQKPPSADVIYGDTMIIDGADRELGLRRLRPPVALDWRSFRHGMLVCHQSFIVRRSTAPLYDMQYRFSADYDWCIRCMRGASEIYNSRLILSRYLSEGATTANRYTSLRERFCIMSRFYGFFPTLMRHIFFLFCRRR